MRYAIVLALLLCGCSEKVEVPARPLPTGVAPKDLDARQWATYLAQSGIQADASAKPFTPTWVGFSAAPSGDLSYYDFGRIINLSWDGPTELVGTSNTTEMQITNLPVAIRPSQTRWLKCLVVNNDFTTEGSVTIGTDGTLQFFFHQVGSVVGVSDGLIPQAGGFNNANSKGVPAGWIVEYVR